MMTNNVWHKNYKKLEDLSYEVSRLDGMAETLRYHGTRNDERVALLELELEVKKLQKKMQKVARRNGLMM